MDFVILANAWQDGLQNPTSKHHVARELAHAGHRVLWVNGAGMRTPSLGVRHDRSRIAKKIGQAMSGIQPVDERIWVIAPLILPFPKSTLIRKLNAQIYLRGALLACRRLGFSKPTFINFLPMVPSFQARWPWYKLYYCVDRWDAFDTYDAGLMSRLDELCCRSADLVITTSAELQRRSLRYNDNTHMVLHGVSYKHFATSLDGQNRPADLPLGGRIFGFIGLLGGWVDQKLLIHVARANPDDQLVLIGGSDVDVSNLTAEPNIHVMGPRPFASLPAYLAHFDVGLIPFLLNDLTLSVNPIKLREMIAAGCPVVSSALPEVSSLADDLPGVEVADSYEAFTGSIDKVCANPLDDGSRRRLSDCVADNTWKHKVKQLLGLLPSVIK
ncbi:MAG: glycosyltransferase family 1 protein [bacterium]|nr:glycosyltransferase family 1 protein [bacterium]